jgi:uroporphyrinogen-III synthase
VRRIAITRSAAANLALEAALADLALELVAVPVTRVELADPAPLAHALTDATLAAVVVASARASEALLAVPGAVARLVRLPIYAVGEVTAAPLRAVALDPRLPMLHTARGLLALVELELGPRLRGARVLYPRAAEARPELAAGLRAAGADVLDVIAYRTSATPADDPALGPGLAALRAGALDALVAYAPSQLEALAGHGVALGAWPVVCVGPTTAASARALGARVVHVADEPTAAAVAAAVRAVYAARHELP